MKKPVKILLVSCASLAVVYVSIILFCAVAIFIKSCIDWHQAASANPYVKSDFAGWRDVYLDKQVSILLPEEWFVVGDPADGKLRICDKNNETIAIMKRWDDNESAQTGERLRLSLLSECSNSTVTAYQTERYRYGEKIDIPGYWCITDTGYRLAFLYVKSDVYSWWVCFTPGESDYYNEAVAIAYAERYR